MNYALAYRIGFHPWEDLAAHPPFAGKLTELLAREEADAGPPFGRALDLGCGSAVWGVEMARRGWQVTGIDLVGRALDRARRRISDAGVEMDLVQGDVTELEGSGVGDGYDLILDTGTFHGLHSNQQRAMGRGVDAIATAQATVILDCFSPRSRGPLPHGASRGDVEAAFPAWSITGVEIADSEPDVLARLFRFDERFYRMERKPEGGN